MIVWSVVLPIVGTVAMLVLLGVGIARSRGLREVLLGIRGKGKVSLLNLFSVEGAGLVLILALFIGGGIVYPLASATSAGELEKLAREVGRLKTEARELREKSAPWQIVGTIEVPGVPQEVLKNHSVRVTVVPWLINQHLPSGSTARFTVDVPATRNSEADPSATMVTVFVEYDNYKTLTVDVPRGAFKDRVYKIEAKLERLPEVADRGAPSRPEVPEAWETRR